VIVAAVIDRMTDEVVSRHRSYQAADKAATKRGERYTVKDMAQAKTIAERQSAYRARQAENGKAEVRGIFATPANAEKIKRYAAKLK